MLAAFGISAKYIGVYSLIILGAGLLADLAVNNIKIDNRDLAEIIWDRIKNGRDVRGSVSKFNRVRAIYSTSDIFQDTTAKPFFTLVETDLGFSAVVSVDFPVVPGMDPALSSTATLDMDRV